MPRAWTPAPPGKTAEQWTTTHPERKLARQRERRKEPHETHCTQSDEDRERKEGSCDSLDVGTDARTDALLLQPELARPPRPSGLATARRPCTPDQPCRSASRGAWCDLGPCRRLRPKTSVLGGIREIGNSQPPGPADEEVGVVDADQRAIGAARGDLSKVTATLSKIALSNDRSCGSHSSALYEGCR
jgi:hypothetical protein